MTHITNAAELVGLVYLALCLLVCGLFLGSVAITDLAWRRRQRKRAKTEFIREWRLP